jgi:hypothetical protein
VVSLYVLNKFEIRYAVQTQADSGTVRDVDDDIIKGTGTVQTQADTGTIRDF